MGSGQKRASGQPASGQAASSRTDEDAVLPPGLEPAGFGRRTVAFFVDAVLCGLVASLFTAPALPRNWSLLVFVLMYPLFVGLFGQSPGLRLLGLRCQGIADGRPIGVFRAALRTLLICTLIPAVLPGPDGRPWHDKIVGSILLRTRTG